VNARTHERSNAATRVTLERFAGNGGAADDRSRGHRSWHLACSGPACDVVRVDEKDSFQMKIRIAVFATIASSFVASAALADELGAEAAPKVRIGAQVELLPTGSLDSEPDSATPKVAYGVGLTFDYAITRNISIGVAPRMIFNVIDKDANGDAASQLDLRARVKGHFPIADKIEAYGFVAPGYSIVMLPDSELDNPAGLVLAFGAGATYDLTPRMFVSGEVGYQLGFQRTEVLGETVDLGTSYLHVGLGAGARF
jgi:hypothetical protein